MVVGIDAGGRKLAVVSLDRWVFSTYEVKPIDYEKFYRGAVEWLTSTFEFIGPEPVYMEAAVVAGARNIQSTIRVAQTTGLVHALLPNVAEVAVSSWKKGTVGNGNAKKTQVRSWLEETYPDIARMCRGSQDLVDAACIALYGRRLG